MLLVKKMEKRRFQTVSRAREINPEMKMVTSSKRPASALFSRFGGGSTQGGRLSPVRRNVPKKIVVFPTTASHRIARKSNLGMRKNGTAMEAIAAPSVFMP